MLQDYTTIYQTALAILSAIITGGFVLVFVEISNKKTRESDSYEQLMRPFMHKLTAYFRFVSWCQSKIRYPKDGLLGGENEFKRIVKQLDSYGSRAITSGGDYRVNMFTAEELYDISYNMINHLWYLTDHRHSCKLQWDSSYSFTDDYIRKELVELNPNYKELPITLESFIKVSSEFHTEIYQKIEADTEIHESRMWLLTRHTRFVSLSLMLVLIILCAFLILRLPTWCIQISTVLVLFNLVICLLLLGTNYSTQIKWYNRISKKIQTRNKTMKSIFTYRLLEPLGLMLLLGAFCWQTVSNEYKNLQQGQYQSYIDNVIIVTSDLVASKSFRDTVNYKGKVITNFDPEQVQKATSLIYSEQDKLMELYDRYRYYYWGQVIMYIIGSVMLIVKKTMDLMQKKQHD